MVVNDKECVLYPSKIRGIVFFVVCVMLVGMGFGLLEIQPFVGWMILIFFGIGLIFFLLQLFFPRSSYLRLTPDRMEVRSLFRSSFYRWEDIDRFYVGYVGRNKMVLIDFAPSYEKEQAARAIACAMAGAEGALPCTYGLSAEKLTDLLNRWRNRAVLEKKEMA